MLQTAFATHRRVPVIGAAILTLVWLAVYASTVSPSVNFIDSGELITALNEPGIAHPPGYPLYTLMGYVASSLLPGEVAWRVNIISAFWGAVAVGTFFLLVLLLTNYLRWTAGLKSQKEISGRRSGKQLSTETVRHRGAAQGQKAAIAPTPIERLLLGLSMSEWLTLAGAAAVASLLGASSTFWSRTAQAKMYTLHYFFVAALFLFALLARWAYERKAEKGLKWSLLALNITLGLSLANHLMTVLMVPGLLLMLLAGSDPLRRFKALLARWLYGIPAVLLPVLLYLYLPVRSSQRPLMNWGSPDNWGDFWRHITGWQYGAYVTGTKFSVLWGFIGSQWSWLSALLLAICAVAGALLARSHLAIFLATLAAAATTLAFSMAYGISEIEPYLVPIYMMLLVWLGAALVALPQALGAVDRTVRAPAQSYTPVRAALTAALLLLALVSAVLQYPGQDHHSDRLAGQFVENALSELPTNSVLITDYWDFYAPSIYLQNVLKLRPDVSIVDISLLKYPWYVGYLQKNSSSLVEKSSDLLPTFQTEQRRWVNGEPYNVQVLSSSYFGLINSFVERNASSRPAYVLFQSCAPGGACDSAQVAPNYERQVVGLTSKLLRKPIPSGLDLPPEPQYKLSGIVGEDRVPMDVFATLNSCLYVQAYTTLSQEYAAANKSAQAQRLSSMASTVRSALSGQCR